MNNLTPPPSSLDSYKNVDSQDNIQEQEEIFNEIANSMPQIVWVANADGEVYWYNDWWYNYTGIAHGEEHSIHWSDANSPLHPEDVSPTLKRWHESVKTGCPYQMEYRFKRKSDGQYRWHLGRAVPIKKENGQVIKWIGSDTDIHDQKILVQRLESERELRENFVAALTHDLRSPLTAAKMKCQLILKKRHNPQAVQDLTMGVLKSLERNDQMINDLLDANRIKAGEPIPLELENFDLVHLARELIQEMNSLMHHRLCLKTPASIQGRWSKNGIRRILENLTSNAYKYGYDGTPIELTLFTQGTSVYLSVHNQGDPISEKDQEVIFSKFKRTKSAEKGGHKGWGIGLTLVQGLTHTMGGEVRVTSSENLGTTFTVILPLEAVTKENAASTDSENKFHHHLS